MIKHFSQFILCLSLVTPCPVFAAPEFQYSGFLRLVAGYLDDEHAEYEGYDDAISLSEDSLIGLQGEAIFNDKLSATVQVLGHSGDDRDSGLEWLYLTYQHNKQFQVKVGQMRTPFFNLSDVLDVGFAYPYITPPQQVYSGMLFDQYQGINASYQTSFNELRLGIETYAGVYEDDFTRLGQKIPTKVDDMFALVAKLGYSNFDFRSAYFTGNVEVDFPAIDILANGLTQAGFIDNANALSTNGRIKVFQNAVSYDDLYYFARIEHVRILSDFQVSPNVKSSYATLGVYLAPVTLHLTVANSDVRYNTAAANQIPLGLDPTLDMLSIGYDTLLSSLPKDDLKTYSLGARWDLRHDLAVKAEVTQAKGEATQRSFFTILDNSAFDREAILYTIALEWVF